MERNPKPGCVFRAWVSQFEYWHFCPALLHLSDAALHYIDILVSLIWDNTRVLDADDETKEEVVYQPEIEKVSVSKVTHAREVAYQFTCSKNMSLRKGQQFVLARA